MEKLNSDVLSEIISRLPTKSVLQCRKVCRLWRSLFGKPRIGILFSDWYPSYGGRVDQGKFYYREELLNFNCIDGQPNSYDTVPKPSFKLVGSCNGLVCYRTYEPERDEFIYISNPITGEYIHAPRAGADYGCTGFGYCQSTNEYKVVESYYNSNGKRCFQVYTLGDGRGWRYKQECTFFNFLGWGVFANGALHWLNEGSLISYDIVSFNLDDETFQPLPLPPCRIPCNSQINVTLEGDLYVWLPYKKQGECMMDIWVFKKNNITNCRRSTPYFNSFTWEQVFSSKCSVGTKCQLLSLTKSEILLWENGILSCYDPATYKKLWHTEGPGGNNVQAVPHMNSLVSLKV